MPAQQPNPSSKSFREYLPTKPTPSSKNLPRKQTTSFGGGGKEKERERGREKEKEKEKSKKQQNSYPRQILSRIIEWKFGKPLDPVVTGPYQWTFIHTISLFTPGNVVMQGELVSIILTNLSCMTCFEKMKDSIQRSPFNVEEAIKLGKEKNNSNLYGAQRRNNLH